jgi:DNA-binding NarL/FixJ family response regulator
MQSIDASWVLVIAGAALAVYFVLRRSFGDSSVARPGTIKGRFAERVQNVASSEPPIEVLRWQVEMHETARELKGELDSKLAALQALVLMARQESQRLETAIKTAEALEIAPPRDRLARIEGLAEPAALASAETLAQVAGEMPSLPGDVAADLFEADQRTLEIIRLLQKGHPVAEISRRLRLPLGEIELLLSLRHT